MRAKTRKQRYLAKQPSAQQFPIRLTAINFRCDGNLAYLIRTAACFGFEGVDVIGYLPSRRTLQNDSGSLVDFVEIAQFDDPVSWLNKTQIQGETLVAAELCEDAEKLSDFKWPQSHLNIIVGNETSGVPAGILKHSLKVYIPMPGVGFCLNTAQTANILAYSAVQQYI